MGLHVTLLSPLSKDSELLLCFSCTDMSAQAGQAQLSFLSTSSLSFCTVGGVLKANPAISLIADSSEVIDIHIVKRWLGLPRFKSVEEEANLTACALNDRLSY